MNVYSCSCDREVGH